jgi:hypothetical protein
MSQEAANAATKAVKINRHEAKTAGEIEEAAATAAAAAPAKIEHKDVHGCSGANSCKGLGGCKVSDEKLAKLAEKRGIPLEEAGEAHACAGLNACKGLGGCHVTQEKFAGLKAKLSPAE